MRIAYILYPEVIISNRSNGIRSQARSWSNSLRQLGHDVILINNWGDYEWNKFDAIHLFGSSGTWHNDVARRLKGINPKLCFSPIIDPKPNRLEKKSVFVKNGVRKICPFLRNMTKDRFDNFQLVFVRSQCEADYLVNIKGVHRDKIAFVPLSYSYAEDAIINSEICEKQDFCLHISSITQERKNVLRLIKAAKKFNFELVLAGNIGTENDFKPFKDEINGASNIKVLGFISEKEKKELYKSAKVFALPSLYEGVGIVAVDAALMGCEIVVSNISGPKEYYSNMASEVNPYSVDEIGMAIKKRLESNLVSQPELARFIQKEYAPSKIAKNIEEWYKKLQ